MIWMLDFEDLPQVFKDYITTRASRIASNRMVNSQPSARLVESDEAAARAAAVGMRTNREIIIYSMTISIIKMLTLYIDHLKY